MSDKPTEQEIEDGKCAIKELAIAAGLAVSSTILPLTTLVAVVAWGISSLCKQEEKK